MGNSSQTWDQSFSMQGFPCAEAARCGYLSSYPETGEALYSVPLLPCDTSFLSLS